MKVLVNPNICFAESLTFLSNLTGETIRLFGFNDPSYDTAEGAHSDYRSHEDQGILSGFVLLRFPVGIVYCQMFFCIDFLSTAGFQFKT